VGYVCATPPYVADSVGNGVSYDDKKVDVTINSVGGQLVVVAAEKITHIEVYSAIGGLLYSAKPNYSEVRIDNLPKTFLVVRLRFANKTTAIYKIKKD
jgi:hypothetical protein